MASITEDEKVRIRRHLGYPNVGVMASLQFGIPKPLAIAFLLESAMNNVLEQAVPIVRETLQTLDGLLDQMREAQELLAVKQIGSIETNPDMQLKSLREDRLYWMWELADIFGVPPYGFSMKNRGGGTGPSISNARVRR